MAEHLSLDELRQLAGDAERLAEAPFEALSDLATWHNGATDDETRYAVRDVLIRFLDAREALGSAQPVLEALIRQVGLYPYIAQGQLGTADAIALEAHRPLGQGAENVVFHEVQAHVYRQLLAGRNVILSAPTSFGKSLIIDSLIASDRYDNVVVVVPTIALLDETRRRLGKFNKSFRVITHVSQRLGDRNIFILTQERVIDHPSLPQIDLFVIDEFYKLDGSADAERSPLLNQAFYKLWKMGGQFYFLGPNIRSLPDELPDNFDAAFVRTDYSTVAFDVLKVEKRDDDEAALLELCSGLSDPTLIFCRSPRQAREVAGWLVSAHSGVTDAMGDARDWIGREFHEDWLFGRALGAGVGIHHGRLPRSLAYLAVRSFNEGKLRFLVCTSTLIEGVNTAAKNVIVFDNRIAMKKFDYFTFRNIQGRSGRMGRHFVGRVFLFHEPPPEELPFVDIPVLTQPESAPDSLLVQIDSDDLNPRSRERMEPYYEQDVLSLEVLRLNSGVPLDAQLAVARTIDGAAGYYNSLLGWSGMPAWEQLVVAAEFVWQLSGAKGWTSGVASAAQLAYRVNHLRDGATAKTMIEEELANPYNPSRHDPDETVEGVLEFLRQWPGHKFPRLLMALHHIQREVFERHQLPVGDYRGYAGQVENLFLPAFLGALDEYGIPSQIASKLAYALAPADDLDSLLERLAALDLTSTTLTEFEREIVHDAQSTLA